jgi:protein SCO1/2
MQTNKSKYIIITVFISLFLVITLIGVFAGFTKKSVEKTAGLKLPVYNTPDFTPAWSVTDDEHTIAPFTFTDQNGKSFGSNELEGKIFAVDFFFTSCPGICPKLTKNLEKVQSAFKNDANVMLLSFSVTPESDNPQVLNTYAAGHSVNYEKWRLLTGSRKEIYNLARKSFFADEDLGLQVNENDFLHTENVLLIDAKGRIRGLYKGTYPLEIEKLIKEINILKSE